MLPFYFLRVPFARAMHFRLQMPSVCAPMIGIKAGQAKRFQQRFELQKYLIFPATKHIRQDGTGMMIDGMPQPPWFLFLADKTPHFVHLGFPCALDVHNNLVWLQRAQQGGVDRLQYWFFLFEFAEDSIRTDA